MLVSITTQHIKCALAVMHVCVAMRAHKSHVSVLHANLARSRQATCGHCPVLPDGSFDLWWCVVESSLSDEIKACIHWWVPSCQNGTSRRAPAMQRSMSFVRVPAVTVSLFMPNHPRWTGVWGLNDAQTREPKCLLRKLYKIGTFEFSLPFSKWGS